MSAASVEKFQNWLKDQGLNQAYISSYDPYLSEYVPPNNSLRVYLTEFKGSVAEVLMMAEGRSHLFVDGRYTEQAENEVNQDLFEIHTSQPGSSPFLQMQEYILKEKLGYVALRTSFANFKSLKDKYELVNIDNQQVEKLVGLSYSPQLNPVEWVAPEKGGVETQKKLSSLELKSDEAYFVTALDSVAWLTNGRGYHLPFLSSFIASAIALKDRCLVFCHEDISREKAWDQVSSVEWVSFLDYNDYKDKLLTVLKENKIIDLKFDPVFVNAADFDFLNSQCQLENLEAKSLLLTKFQANKYPEEIHMMKGEYLKASQAVFNTIKWTRKHWQETTERGVYNETSRFYRELGGHTQSFNVIAGFAANGSIIHYGNPSDQIKLKDGEIFLLDSGGYFESGLATDKTRTFLIGDKPNKELFKEIYTLVLKGLLALQFSEFEEGTLGKDLDAITRAPLKAKGYDYNHGTGHGIGVHVHEGGVRIHMSSELPMKAGQVVSLEPGIYLPGVGGVRLENIGHVVKNPKTGKLKFDNLVFIGFEHALIDESQLSEQESQWLEEYERECESHGLSFKYNKDS